MIHATWEVILELAPWLLLGTAIAGLLHVFLPADFMRRQLSGRGGVLKAVSLGVPLPLCSCGVIPVGLGLKKSGAANGPIIGFLISTPQTGVDSILVSANFLGWPFALLKVVAALVTGIAGGWIADTIDDAPSDAPAVQSAAAQASRGRLVEFTEHAVMLIRSIWGWLVIGILVSAAISAYMPPDAFAQWGLDGLGGVGAMLIALAVSTPLYVCAVASVPIAAALVASGMPAGAALVFLMAGPATNIATLGAVYRTLGRKMLAVYLGTVIVGSVVSGMLFGFVIDGGSTSQAAMHHGSPWWAVASAAALIALLLWFAWQDGVALLRRRAAMGAETPGAIEVAVDGMTCGNCTAKLERQLVADEHIATAIVTLNPGRVQVRGDVSAERVRELVQRAGFDAPLARSSTESRRD